MAASVRNTMLEMLSSTVRTMEVLLAADDDCLEMHTSHVCGHDKNTWTLITNLIDHETEHMQQVLHTRYEEKSARTPMERLVAEWLEVRARFLGSLVGLTDERFNEATEEGHWTFAEIADHLAKLEQHALATMAADGALPATTSSPR
ncbi:MAG: DinB family protein [bacterium]